MIHPVYFNDISEFKFLNPRSTIPIWNEGKKTLVVTNNDSLIVDSGNSIQALELDNVKAIGIVNRNSHDLLVLHNNGNLYKCENLSDLNSWDKMKLLHTEVIDIVLNRHAEVVFMVKKNELISRYTTNIELPKPQNIKSLRHCSIVTNDGQAYLLMNEGRIDNIWVKVSSLKVKDALTSYYEREKYPAVLLLEDNSIMRAKLIDRQEFTLKFRKVASGKRLLDITSISNSDFYINMEKVFVDLNDELQSYNCDKNRVKPCTFFRGY